jgi:hypothetical protein
LVLSFQENLKSNVYQLICKATDINWSANNKYQLAYRAMQLPSTGLQSNSYQLISKATGINWSLMKQASIGLQSNRHHLVCKQTSTGPQSKTTAVNWPAKQQASTGLQTTNINWPTEQSNCRQLVCSATGIKWSANDKHQLTHRAKQLPSTGTVMQQASSELVCSLSGGAGALEATAAVHLLAQPQVVATSARDCCHRYGAPPTQCP